MIHPNCFYRVKRKILLLLLVYKANKLIVFSASFSNTSLLQKKYLKYCYNSTINKVLMASLFTVLIYPRS